MKIIVATDGLVNARACLDTLRDRRPADDSMIKVVSVYDPVSSRFFSKRLSAEKAEELVKEGVAAITEDHPQSTVTGAVLKGHPATKILELAEEFQPNIIFLGAHARRTWKEEFLGSVADEVLRRSNCTVVVVRAAEEGGSRPEKKHLLCYDDTPVTMDAMLELELRIWPADAELMVLHVVSDPVHEGSHNVSVDVQMAATRLEKRRKTMQERIDAQVDSLQRLLPSHPVSGKIVDEEHGGVVDSILEVAESWGADLIALGSHKRQGLDRFWLGSVSEAVAAHASCSVEIIRQPSYPEKEDDQGGSPA